MGVTADPNDDNLIRGKCKALLALRRFSDAAQFHGESNGLSTTNTAFKDRLKMEYERGQYDLLAMIEEAKKSNLLDNHTDYAAWNKFEIRQVAGKGRGLVATNKIEAGELLIACKAFVFVETKSEVSQSMDHGGSRTASLQLALDTLTEKARKKLSDRPDLAEEFYDLYDGAESDRIKGIIESNNFTAEDIFGKLPIADAPMGLWLIPSYINHTCVDTNCFRYFVGDYMFVRATKSIEMAKEILLPYVPPTEPFEKRQSTCKEYGFDCQCRLCVVDRENPLDEIMQRTMDEMNDFMDDVDERMNHFGYDPSGDIQTMEKFRQELLQLRPQRDLNYMILRIQESMAISTDHMNDTESLGLMMEYFRMLKSNDCWGRALEISTIMYKRQARRSEGMNEQEKWIEEARGIAKLIYGDERLADLILKEGSR